MREGFLDVVVAHYRALLGDRLVGLVLYGSRARGDARPDSDLDLFLLARDLPRDPWERARALGTPPGDLWRDPPISIRALTPEEYERDIASVDLDVAIDGKILFDRDGYVAERQALVRRRIEEAGLVRGPDLIWLWKEPPSRVDWAVRWEGVVR